MNESLAFWVRGHGAGDRVNKRHSLQRERETLKVLFIFIYRCVCVCVCVRERENVGVCLYEIVFIH